LAAALLEATTAKRDEMLVSLAALVDQESPSTDKGSLDRLAMHLAEVWRDIGGRAAVIENSGHGNHVRVVFGGSTVKDGEPRPGLVLGHFDTVWPVGTAERRPMTVQDGRALGPGAFDMKAGLVIAEYALRAVRDLRLVLPRPIVLLFNSDEEIGSGTSRAMIEEAAARSEYVLVLEPAVPGGALKTARKGVGEFVLAVAGRASHSGAAHEEGESAVEELAQQIVRLHQMTNYDVGTTVNVGVIEGGTRPNVVAAYARARIDVRAWTREEAERIAKAIRGLQPVNPATTLTISGGFDRYPMERTPGTVRLFEAARRLGGALGLNLEERASGGASDGNFTAALGVPTLDGLGAVGDGSHAEHEYVDVTSLPERAALLALLLCEL
jgi:glutamate carboxypeptidase